MIDIIPVSYSEFKAILASKRIRPQHRLVGNRYFVWAYDHPMKYETTVWNDTTDVNGIDAEAEALNKADFQATILPTSNRCLMTSPISGLSKFHGRKLEMAAGDTTGFVEWSFDTDVEINKVLPRPVAAQSGDHVIMQVWSKQGVVVNEQNPTGAPVPLEDFGDGMFLVGGDGNHGNWYQGAGGGKIPSYCTVRCVYTKAAGTERVFLIDAEFIV